MKKILLIYNFPQKKDSVRIKFNRAIFKYKTQSHGGKYQKLTNGVLSKFEKPARSCVIFNENKINDVKQVCHQFGINAKFYQIRKITD